MRRLRFNNLPKEIMLEILTRLPTELVLDCKLVCKPWRDLILLPSFSKLHLDHLNSSGDSAKLSFVFLTRYPTNVNVNPITEELYYAEYDEKTPFIRKTRINIKLPDGYSFVGSCNGLICIDSWYNDYYGPTYIFNPITREYVTLPAFKGEYWWTGFGYIASTNEYKVVRLYESGEGSNVRSVQVYTLGSSTGWRNVGTMDRNRLAYRTSAGVFANGALYWESGETILTFHLTDEKFSNLASPNFPLSLGVLGDFVSATYRGSSGEKEIWSLKKNNDDCNDLTWSIEFGFDIRFLRILWPFGHTKTGRLLCYQHNKIYRYDPKASSAVTVLNFGKPITAVIPHNNTLVSLKLLGEKDAKIMESGERESSSEETGNSAKVKNKPQNEVRDL